MITTRGPRPDQHLGQADAGQHADVARTEQVPGLIHVLARRDVLPDAADVATRVAGRVDLDVVRTAIGVLVRHDRVGVRGHRRAGHHLHRRARRQPVRRRGAGGDLADHRQADRAVLLGVGDVRGPDRVAVHGRVFEARQIDGGDDLLAQREIQGIQQLLPERGQLLYAAEQVVPMRLHRPQGAPIRLGGRGQRRPPTGRRARRLLSVFAAEQGHAQHSNAAVPSIPSGKAPTSQLRQAQARQAQPTVCN